MAVKKCISPKGELEWVNISGEGKENMSGKMQYVASVVLDGEAAEKMKAEINAFWEENKPKSFKKDPKSLGFYAHSKKTDETDEDGKAIYEEDGKTLFQFKTGTTYNDGKTKVIRTYNSKAKEVALGETKIGNGSIGAISGAMGTYENKTPNGKTIVDAGVTLYLDAIKISKLVEFTQATGFEADDDDDGWEGDEGWEGDDSDAPSAGPRL